jgi:hypothetical protein
MSENYVNEAPVSREQLQGQWLRDVCRIGQGPHCCRYIVCDAGGFDCARHMPDLAGQINARAEAQTMNARAINCPGLQRERADVAP